MKNTTLEGWVGRILSVCTPAQRDRVVAVLERHRELVQLSLGARPMWKADRDVDWGLWRLLVIGDPLTDLAVREAVGFVDSWRPGDEPGMLRRYYQR